MQPMIQKKIPLTARVFGLSALALGIALTTAAGNASANATVCADQVDWSPGDHKTFSTDANNPYDVCVDIDGNGMSDFQFTVQAMSDVPEDTAGTATEIPGYGGTFVQIQYAYSTYNKVQIVPEPTGTVQTSGVEDHFAANLDHETRIDADSMKNSADMAFLYLKGMEDKSQFDPNSSGFVGLQFCPAIDGIDAKPVDGCGDSIHYAWLSVAVENGSLILKLGSNIPGYGSGYSSAAGSPLYTPPLPTTTLPPPRPVPVDGAAPWAALGLLLAGFGATRRRRNR